MLLAAALVAPVLGKGLFGGDESGTMLNSCARHLGPCSPAEAIQELVSRSPDHAWGLVIAFSQWGQLVGWSEFAIRALPWLAGPLTLAWVYRLGRDLFSPIVALTAVLLLSTSVLFLTYMRIARFYVPAMLFTTVTLWGYWRVALAARQSKRGERLALLAGAASVLYSQYFSALLIPALGLFHLLFVRKDRRWRQAAVLLALAALSGLPQIPGLLGGIAYNQDNAYLQSRALQAHKALALFANNLSNGVLRVPYPLVGLLLPAMALFLLQAVRKCRLRNFQPGAARYLALASVLLSFLMLAANQWAKVLAPGRVRYLASLWPPVLLLLSAIIHNWLRGPMRKLALVLAAIVAFSGAADFRWAGEKTSDGWSMSRNRVTIPVINRIAAEAGPDSLLLVDPVVFGAINRSYEYYTGYWGIPAVPLFPHSPAAELVDQARDHQDLWLLYLTASEEALHIPGIVDQLAQQGWTRLLDWQDGPVTLQHLRSTRP